MALMGLFVRYGFDGIVCSLWLCLFVMVLVGLFVRYGFDGIVYSLWLG